ncbi:MAG TPA: CHAD domain-containing protein [Burkholderiales bacterium]|nr:CHAD domain-containing protein [Burkholderiales bacterium]
MARRKDIPDPGEALARELDHALALLARGLDDEVAHEFRRSMKRARSLLGLMREEVGDAAYRRENRALRDAARALAPMRDARVLRQALARLGTRARVPRPKPASTVRLARVLAGTRARTAGWRMPRASWPALAAGIERLYRHGRRALRAAEEHPTDRNLHESRKQVKRLGAALAFLAPAGATRLKKAVQRADAVAHDLGDDHDLALVARRPPGGRLSPGVQRKLVERRRKLQERALREAHRLFRAKPNKFVTGLSLGRKR